MRTSSEQLAVTTAYNITARAEQLSIRPGYNVSEKPDGASYDIASAAIDLLSG
jgi:hypothetical protein